jgi:hypothetical protein
VASTRGGSGQHLAWRFCQYVDVSSKGCSAMFKLGRLQGWDVVEEVGVVGGSNLRLRFAVGVRGEKRRELGRGTTVC